MLEVDVTAGGFGPETITIKPDQASGTLREGTFRFYVENWQGNQGQTDITISDSGASLEVFTATGLVQRVETPPGSDANTLSWVAFDITLQASGGFLIEPVNTFFDHNTSDDLFPQTGSSGTFKIGESQPDPPKSSFPDGRRSSPPCVHESHWPEPPGSPG